METKHTPGPWGFLHKLDREGFPYIAIETSIDGAIIIGDMYYSNEENARLIAAAPDMYSLLRELRDSMSCNEEHYQDELQRINEVLAPLQSRKGVKA